MSVADFSNHYAGIVGREKRRIRVLVSPEAGQRVRVRWRWQRTMRTIAALGAQERCDRLDAACSAVVGFRLGSRSSPRSSYRPLSLEWQPVAGRIQERLRETPDGRDHAQQIVLGNRQPILVEEASPTICVQRLACECIGQALQRLDGNARGPACERTVD